MNVDSIIAVIEQVADPALQAEWDKSGLQVAASRQEAAHIGVFLDPVPKTIAKALDAGADFLVCHHPLALRPGLPNRLNAYHEALRLLLTSDTALYAAHTSLDVNLDGPAGWLGRALGLTNCHPLEPVGKTGNRGYGESGNLPEAVPVGRLVNTVLNLTRMECANLAGPVSATECRRVAYCGGSGASLLPLAQAAGADLYITGDVKYHAAVEAEIPVLDVGHHSLEEEMMRRFALLLAGMLPEAAVEFFPSLSPFRRACQ